MFRHPLRYLFAASLALTGCGALLDVNDLYFDPNADGGTGPDGLDASREGSVSPDGSMMDDGGDVDATLPCVGDLSTNKDNCGRCGHSCLGGECAAGMCQPVILAAGLGNPEGIALGPNDVYFTALASEAVLSVSKNGGPVMSLASSVTRARGVAVDGNTLYWGNGDYIFDDAGSNGGVWKCTLPGCTGKKLVAAGDWAAYPNVRGGYVYYGEQNNDDVLRAPVGGGPSQLLAATHTPFGIAVDDTHVYYTSKEPNVYRALVDGGSYNNSEEVVGSEDGIAPAFIVVDDQRAYWTFTDNASAGHVVSVAKASPSAGTLSYGSSVDNVSPVGVAVDATNIYWATDGTASGTPLAPNGDGNVYTCPKQGCGGGGPVKLASGNMFAGPIAVDDTAIYWVEFGTVDQSNGRLRKLAKP